MIGPSKSGKSLLCLKLLKNLSIFEGKYDKIIYIASYVPSFSKELKKVIFLDKVPTEELPSNSIIIFDDMIYNPEGMKLASQYAFRDCNHRNSIAIVMTQRIYVSNDNFRMISDNCDYIILFKQLRGEQKLKMLARDVFPSKLQKYFFESYNHATKEQYGYLVIDIGFATIKSKSLYSRITAEEGVGLQYKDDE